eukprot:jgi/Astpho2/1652/Aster-x0487
MKGTVRLIAGPGSGKTRVLTQRVAWLIQQQGVQPHEIVVITFTKKAALELQDRLAHLLGRQARSINAGV